MLITAEFGSNNTGADVYYTILNPDKSVYQARTNAGVTELDAGSGVYGVLVLDVDLSGRTVLWDINNTAKVASETFSDSTDVVVSSVWNATTRTLSTFGTLVADIVSGVWGYATRTLSAFGFSVTVGTNNDKTGYSLSTPVPTVIDIDSQLSSTHGDGLWTGGGGGSGSGAIPVNHNTGGTDNLRYVTSDGIGVDNATITAYLASDFYAGNITQPYSKGNSTTNVEGRWVTPIMLDANDYIITFCKQGDFNTTWKAVTVS